MQLEILGIIDFKNLSLFRYNVRFKKFRNITIHREYVASFGQRDLF